MNPLTTDGFQCVTVYIVEFEPLPPNSVGGWDWYYRLEDADKREDQLMAELGGAYRINRKRMTVPFKPADSITDFIADSGVLDSP